MARTKKQETNSTDVKKKSTPKVKEEKKETIDLSNIKDELKSYVDEQVKKELQDYVDKQVKKEISDEITTANKKLIKEKNKKIFFKNIIILILLAVIVFLMYLLYDNDYFDKYFISEEVVNNSSNVSQNKNVEEIIKESTLEELKAEYGNLIDNVILNEESAYVDDYYDGKLSQELKNYLVLNNMDFSKLTVEDDYNIIDEDDFKEEYNKLFEDYTSSSFFYNDNKVRYISKLDSYITDSLLNKNTSNIQREIIDIKVDNDIVSITTVEGLVRDNKLYNVVSKEEIENYKEDSLTNYQDDLNLITYIFDNNILVSIKKYIKK